ncbi:MAG: autotransporter domain-containing protein, partial [Planctomycetia bacterium]|nr:autotransporter domain-containing protein [Planctomycetia bacterium]
MTASAFETAVDELLSYENMELDSGWQVNPAENVVVQDYHWINSKLDDDKSITMQGGALFVAPDTVNSTNQLNWSMTDWVSGAIVLKNGANMTITTPATQNATVNSGFGNVTVENAPVGVFGVAGEGTLTSTASNNQFTMVGVSTATFEVQGDSSYWYIGVTNNGLFRALKETTVEEDILLDNGNMELNGNTTISGLIDLKNRSNAIFNGNAEVGNIVVDGASDIYFTSDTTIQGTVKVTDGSYAWFSGNVTYDENASLSIEGNSSTALNSKNINTNISLNTSYLFVGDNLVEGFLNDPDNPIDDFWCISAERATSLSAINWETSRASIENAIANGQIHQGILEGNGVLAIASCHPTLDENYNGTIIVMDGNYDNWAGHTVITQGTIVLNAGTVYGNKSEDSTFIVENEITAKDKAFGKYYVALGGMLAFYRGDSTEEAAILRQDNVYFLPSMESIIEDTSDRMYYNGGARLWLDASREGCLGTIDANYIRLDDSLRVWYDGVSKLNEGDTMTFNLTKNGGEIQLMQWGEDTTEDLVDGAQYLTLTDDEATRLIESVFGSSDFVNVNFDIGTGVVNITRNNNGIIDSYELTDTQREYVNQIMTNVTSKDTCAADDFADLVYNYGNEECMKNLACDISKSYGAIAQASTLVVHLGSVGSSFGPGMLNITTSFGTDDNKVRGQEENLPAVTTGTPADPTSAANSAYNYGNSSNRTWTPWVSYSHTMLDGKEYVEDGISYDAYEVRRSGVLVGFRSQLSDSLSAGILFAYSNPEMNQSGNFAGYNNLTDGGYASDVDMTDFQFAMHFEKLFGWRQDWEFSAFIGGGAQSMDWNRNVWDTGVLHQFNGDTTGNTFTATFYLSKRLELSDRLTLRPTVGFDSEHNWLYGFTENGTDAPVDSFLSAHTRRQQYEEIQYSRNTFRVGLSASFVPCHKRGGLNTRIFYGRQLEDESAPEVTLHNDLGDWNVKGHGSGLDSLTLGAGGYWYFDAAQTFSISADYNAIL